VTKRWKNRVTAKVEVPLFAGYVFVKIARSCTSRVLEIPLVHSIVGNGREALALCEAEIDVLRMGLPERQVDPHPYLMVGDFAQIHSGPLAGLRGIVVRKNDQLRFVLSIDLIKRSVAVHVTADELEPCAALAAAIQNKSIFSV
jgi:transcription antitermination factor NusG